MHYHFLYDKRKSLAVDVGGCAGTYSRMYSSLFDSVKLFEPNENWLDFLNDVCQENVEIIKIGLWSEATELQFFQVDKLDESPRGLSTFMKSSLNDLQYRETKDFIIQDPVTVCVKALDDYNLDYCSFVKIDAEGAEFEILQGMKNTIQKHKPTLQIEITTDYEKVLDFLNVYGYTDIHANNDYDMGDHVFLYKEKVI